MPTYELECTKCGAQETLLLKVADLIPPCECGGERIKLISCPGLCRTSGPRGVIVDERQVWDSHGRNWRDRENKDPCREGGGRKRIYST